MFPPMVTNADRQRNLLRLGFLIPVLFHSLTQQNVAGKQLDLRFQYFDSLFEIGNFLA